jgi:hypothetical protein
MKMSQGDEEAGSVAGPRSPPGALGDRAAAGGSESMKTSQGDEEAGSLAGPRSQKETTSRKPVPSPLGPPSGTRVTVWLAPGASGARLLRRTTSRPTP